MQPEAREMIGIQSDRECQQNWVWVESNGLVGRSAKPQLCTQISRFKDKTQPLGPWLKAEEMANF
ncbi:MAG: hypothetical protein LH628_16210 [Microcoleus sp. CAN_BIN18]|nr:hypothetical protein [Microcoleus sp. CAN_BIN18]